jgi:nucleoside-diphosphate-sugar epimerase
MRILILGGYGVFGGRLAELLSDILGLELIICGRNLSRAEAFCVGYVGRARVRPLALDRLDIAQGLRAQHLILSSTPPVPFRTMAPIVTA